MTTHPKSDYIPQCFYRHVQERPDAIYLTQPLGGGRVDDFSFQRVMDEAKRIAAYLRAQDFPKGSKIAIISKNCAHFIITDLAIWMAGHVSVALYPTLTEDIVSYILDHSEAKLVFIGKLDDEPWQQMKPGIPDALPKVAYPLAPPNDYVKWNDLLRDHAPIDDAPERDPDDEALIIYTSGSTGKPKGVLHSFRTISEPTFGGARLLRVGQDDRMLSYLPLAHSFDRWVSECISLYTGCRLWFAESVDTFVEDVKRARPTLFVSVPRLWLKFQLGVFKKMPPKKLRTYMKIPILSGIVKKKILEGLGLDHVRFAASGSAPIPAELIQWYNDLGLELREGYGMSENFYYSHVNMEGRGRPGYVGEAHPEVECKLSEQNEVLVKSPGTMLGYYKDPERTKETFTDDGFLKTGDQGEIDEMGRLKITGRIKELFKTSKGKYVAPVPIENLLNANNHVELCLVGGSSQPATFAVIQLAEDIVPEVKANAQKRAEVHAEMEQLLRQVNAQLPSYEHLQFLVIADRPWTIEDGQLTPTMKIKRNVLEKQYEPELEKWYASRQKVIWQE